MADCARGRLRARRKELEAGLRGRVTDHHRRLLDMLLRQSEFLDTEVARPEKEIRERLAPRQELVDRLAGIPSVGEITAWTILAEVGFDMDVFRTPELLCSWPGLCPSIRMNAGKRKSGRTRKGNRWLRRALAQAGLGAANAKDSYIRSFYWRIAACRRAKKSRTAVGRKQLIIAFFMIREGVAYREPDAHSFDRRQPERTRNLLVKRLENLGFKTPMNPQPGRRFPKLLNSHCFIGCFSRRNYNDGPPREARPFAPYAAGIAPNGAPTATQLSMWAPIVLRLAPARPSRGAHTMATELHATLHMSRSIHWLLTPSAPRGNLTVCYNCVHP